MKAKELIEENNEKRKQLTKENLKYYEDMLVYIRLSFSKSEQETEEILSELLDHLLLAQKEGRTAKEIFGNAPKQLANNIIGELPRMVTKETVGFFAMIILYFLAASVFFSGISHLIIYYVFNIGELVREFHVGSASIKAILSIPIAFLLLCVLIYYLRWSCFKKRNKILEFMIFWFYSLLSLGIFVLLFFLIPDFGPVVAIPAYVFLLVGIVLYVAARITRAKV
ncbi:DUF1129 family protein [Lentibacillus jeotgali]|uniref:DUF1129 family protein n=1 Tax=Lentibacillus jeotgali TaxID=558169 RepID=UPI0002627418|nr:DUF1129 family protein [Lentibacillus jeotgali]